MTRPVIFFAALIVLVTACWGIARYIHPTRAVNHARRSHSSTNPPRTSLPQFTDVTESCGLDFVHTDGGSGRKFFVEQFCSGCGFVDYDGDGWIDIIGISGAPLPGYKSQKTPRAELYHNNHDGTFTKVTDQAHFLNDGYGGGLCAGDYDNDGDVDVFVTNVGTCKLFRNNGDGTFTDATTAAHADVKGLCTSSAFGDYDRDGDLDLYVCRYIKYSLDQDRWCSQIKGKKSYCGPEVYPGNSDVLLRNNGDGTFTDVAKTSGIASLKPKSLGVVWTDYNNDGWQDIYLACDLVPNVLWRNNKDGTFTDVALEAGVSYNDDGAAEAGMGVDAQDYDNDGNVDIIVTNYSYESYALYHNEGNGAFTYVSSKAGISEPTLLPLGFGVHLFDFNLDGRRDLFFANGHVLDDVHEYNQTLEYAQKNQLFLNRGNDTFEEVTNKVGAAFQKKFVARGSAVGDYDNDGDFDVLVANNKGPLRLLRNDGGNNNAWLTVKIVGTRSNRDGIGARVTVECAGKRQTAELHSGSSYLSQSDLRLNFGLGNAQRADDVTVLWPSGARESFGPQRARQFVRLREGTGSPLKRS